MLALYCLLCLHMASVQQLALALVMIFRLPGLCSTDISGRVNWLSGHMTSGWIRLKGAVQGLPILRAAPLGSILCLLPE